MVPYKLYRKRLSALAYYFVRILRFPLQLPGGSYIELYELLNKFVCEIKIVGSAGSFVLTHNGEKLNIESNDTASFVAVKIKLIHLPDNLDN
jgi:hypothetical protein